MYKTNKTISVVLFSLCCLLFKIDGYKHRSVSAPNMIKKQELENRKKNIVHNTATFYVSFFCPEDPVSDILADLIDREETKIRIAMYSFSDEFIAKKLKKALDRGVIVEIILSKSREKAGQYNKIRKLLDSANATWLGPSKEWRNKNIPAGKHGVMHNKFVIFDSQKWLTGPNKSVLWTGSYNFTPQAQSSVGRGLTTSLISLSGSIFQ